MSKHQIIYVILLLPMLSKAQNKIDHTNMLWAGYYNTSNFNKNWSVVSDAQVRTKDWTKKWSQFLIRSGVNYAFNNHFAVTAGLAFFKHTHYIDKELLLKNEWRPWQELSYKAKLKKINLNQRLRTEQRFLQLIVNDTKSKQYEYVFRLRYRIDGQIPLKENRFNLLLGDEVLVNPGFINSNRFFDQNRIFAGLHFKVRSNTTLQCQYLKILQWRSSTTVLEDQNVFRVNIQQQFNFKAAHESK